MRRFQDLSSCDSGDRRTVAGLDVSYDKASESVAAAAVVVELGSLATSESSTVLGEARFPYIPGLLSFREAPILLDVLEKMVAVPDVLVCDGYGLAHPRRFGLACHIGVVTGIPTFGVAKSPFMARCDEPGGERGAWSPLLDGADIVGRALRTQAGVKPVFVSVGHKISIEEAAELTLAMCRFRIPESIRRADALSRSVLRAAVRMEVGDS